MTPLQLTGLEGKVAVVTGGGRMRSIGRPIAVEMAKAGSHSQKGWERFTDAIIRLVNDKPEPVVFMLWGSYAQKKAGFVDTSRHLVLKAAHPSPLSAHNGFLGCKHFSQCNAFIATHDQQPIDWSLPECPA